MDGVCAWRRGGRETRWADALALLVFGLSLMGCESEAELRWGEAEAAWQQGRPEAHELWTRLDPHSERGIEAARLLAESDSLYAEGLDHLEDGDPRARSAFEEAKRLAPIDPEHYLRMAHAYADLGYPERASQYFGRFIDAFPGSELAEHAERERAELGVPADLLATDRSRRSEPPSAAPSPALVALTVVAPALLLAFILFALRRRQRRRNDLARLVTRQPELQAGVAYLIGSLRHELLKHRVGAAGAFVQAIEEGAATDEQRDFLERRLFAEPGIARAWSAHLDAFSQLLAGRLDVRVDPLFRRADRAVSDLCDAEPLLARDPERAHRVIERSYRALRSFDGRLSDLVHGFDTAIFDHALLLTVCREVRSEVLAGEVGLEALDVPRSLEPVPIRMFAADLRLVLKNLVRNATLASEDSPHPRVAIVIGEEMEPTGEEVVVIRVLDTGAEVKADALRRGDLGSGLGLVCSVLDRHGGSIGVERAPAPFTKAIALRLFRAYPEIEEQAA